jgi:hypothetical protein
MFLVLGIAAVLPFACNKESAETEAEPRTTSGEAESKPPKTEASVEPAGDAPSGGREEGSPAGSATAGGATGARAVATDAPAAPGPKAPTPAKPAPAPAPEAPKGYTGPDPCRTTNFKFASTRRACEQGGVKQAKAQMKAMVKRAKDDGKEMKCSSCHDDTKIYTLKPNAVEDMRALQ